MLPKYKRYTKTTTTMTHIETQNAVNEQAAKIEKTLAKAASIKSRMLAIIAEELKAIEIQMHVNTLKNFNATVSSKKIALYELYKPV